MVSASVLDETWLASVQGMPGPYFFVAEGVLVYLPEEDVTQMLARLAQRFPGALTALDTYSQQTFRRQQQLAARRGIARWQWACDDPRSFERLGLTVLDSATITRPPKVLRAQLTPAYRFLLPLASPVLGPAVRTTLFQAR